MVIIRDIVATATPRFFETAIGIGHTRESEETVSRNPERGRQTTIGIDGKVPCPGPNRFRLRVRICVSGIRIADGEIPHKGTSWLALQ